MANIAINGFGRIGRQFLKLALDDPSFNIIAINDLGDPKLLVYLLKYDSIYGRFDKQITINIEDGKTFITVDGKRIRFLQEKDPANLPWKDLGVDVVVEATGIFTKFETARVHVNKAGARRVVITAPAKDDDVADAKTVLMGVNTQELHTCTLSSNGSCTTNSASPVMQVLVEKLGIEKAFLTTIHGYTASQNLIDGPTKKSDWRRGRAAAQNIVPSSTGAAIAVSRAIHELQGKFDGVAMRVPVIVGSISQMSFISKNKTSIDEINGIFKEAEKEERWKGLLKTTEDPIVSTDIIGDPTPSIVDISMTRVVDGNLCAIYSWYDNELGYTTTLVKHVQEVVKTL